MSKVALAIKTADILPVPEIYEGEAKVCLIQNIDWNTLEYHLLDRSVCETDDTYLQIIPYITLLDETNKEDDVLYIYSRGKGGNENRLHGKCSIGLGGHVEELPNEEHGIIHVLTEATIRELNEEVGLPVTDHLRSNIATNLRVGNYRAFYCFSDAVGRVHLAINMLIAVDPNTISNPEEEAVSNGRWVKLGKIGEMHHNGDIELEDWSKVVYASATGQLIMQDPVEEVSE